MKPMIVVLRGWITDEEAANFEQHGFRAVLDSGPFARMACSESGRAFDLTPVAAYMLPEQAQDAHALIENHGTKPGNVSGNEEPWTFA